LTIRSFEIFLAVCDRMNMSRAAETLFVTQAAVSHSIAAMEEYYGVKLFERRSGKLFLTPAGEYLRENCGKVLADIDRIKDSIGTYRNAKKRIRLGCTLTIGEYFIHDFLEWYYRDHPDVEVYVGSYSGRVSEELLMRGELDLILNENSLTPGILDVARIFTDEVFFICRRNSRHITLPEAPAGERVTVEKEAVRGLPVFIQDWDNSALNMAELSLRAQRVELEIIGHLNSFEEIKKAVKKDFGIGTISSLALTDDPDILPFKIRGLSSRRNIFMAICKQYTLSPELLELMDGILAYVEELAARSDGISLPRANDGAF